MGFMENKKIQNGTRIFLGLMMIGAGIGHLTFARKEFQAQVPNWVPLEKDDTVYYSGIAEIALGTALLAAKGKQRNRMGNVLAAFYTAVFPGNVAQWQHRRDAFGLNTDNKRFARLFLQPLLIAGAWWSTRKNAQ